MTDLKTPSLTRSQFLKLAGGAAFAATMGLPALAATGPLLKRKIPKTGEEIPVIGLGTAYEFSRAANDAEYNDRKEVIRTLLDGGATVIDTAPVYADAEKIIGRALAELKARPRAFIATKISTGGRDNGVDQFEGTLKDLRTDKVELEQIHNLRDTDVHFKTLAEYKAQGRVRYIGVTHYLASGLEGLEAAMRRHPFDFIQINYSIDARESERRVLPLARDLGMAVLINVPFGRGGVFRKVRGQALPDWAKEFDAETWGQFFLKFVLATVGVTAAIPSTTKPRNMADNLGAGRGRLPDAAMKKRMIEHFEKL
ncbi:MAG: aldo/keto reductase [Alphaproteobacteria bacterium]|nr:aldo/keto reductase [Alphaproteobacteria bacterium]